MAKKGEAQPQQQAEMSVPDISSPQWLPKAVIYGDDVIVERINGHGYRIRLDPIASKRYKKKKGKIK